MKKRVLNVLCLILAILIIASMFATFNAEREKGSYTVSLQLLTQQDKEWIIGEFGDCNTIEELLSSIESFVADNFIYKSSVINQILLQSFRFGKFRKNFTGVCFDFSCFVKTVCIVWAENKNIDVKCYVIDCELENKQAHSYNYLVTADKTYYMDFTQYNTLAKKGKSTDGTVFEIGNKDMLEYSKWLGDEVRKVY